MVVTAQHLATEVGVDVLRRGGNAVDAAVAVGYALAVVYPAAGNLGGGGFMTLQLADGRKTFLDFREKAPLAATREHVPRRRRQRRSRARPRTGHLAVGVPGTVSGLETALAKYGTMKRADLIAPAIRFAEQGFVLDAGRRRHVRRPRPRRSRSTRRRGDLPQGRRPALRRRRPAGAEGPRRRRCARSARRAPPASTRARSARAIVASSSAGKGLITQADLDQYTTRELAPVECDYRGYHVVSAPPPSSGGVIICEILNVLEGYPLKDWGFRSAQAVHVQIEAMRHAYVDRNSYLGDPDFVKNPLDRLLDKAYAAQDPRRDRPGEGGDLEGPEARRAAARGQQHDALLDRRRPGQRGVGDLHAQRLVRRQGHRGRHRRAAQRRDGRLHRQARRAQHLRPGAGRGQRDRAGQAAAQLDEPDHRHARTASR